MKNIGGWTCLVSMGLGLETSLRKGVSDSFEAPRLWHSPYSWKMKVPGATVPAPPDTRK